MPVNVLVALYHWIADHHLCTSRRQCWPAGMRAVPNDFACLKCSMHARLTCVANHGHRHQQLEMLSSAQRRSVCQRNVSCNEETGLVVHSNLQERARQQDWASLGSHLAGHAQQSMNGRDAVDALTQGAVQRVQQLVQRLPLIGLLGA